MHQTHNIILLFSRGTHLTCHQHISMYLHHCAIPSSWNKPILKMNAAHYICHSNPPLYQYVTSEHINNAHSASWHIVLVLSQQTERPYAIHPPQPYTSSMQIPPGQHQHQLPHTLTLICNQSEHTPVINHDIHFLSYHIITIMNMN